MPLRPHFFSEEKKQKTFNVKYSILIGMFGTNTQSAKLVCIKPSMPEETIKNAINKKFHNAQTVSIRITRAIFG